MFKVGDEVDYHAVIGGPVTLERTTIRGGPYEMPSAPGVEMWKIKGRAGMIHPDALTLRNPVIVEDVKACMDAHNYKDVMCAMTSCTKCKHALDRRA